MLEIKNVTKCFDNKVVLDDISLNIESGSVFGLVGINGAGKSTLLRCISGVYRTNGGEILLNGENTYTNPDIRKELFFVADDPYLPSSSTIATQLEYYKAFYSLDEEIAMKYFRLLKLDMNQPFSSFSKGMKRQAVLVFALAIKPKCLMLDEMFDGLDPLVRLIFKKAIIELLEDESITVIISSHNLKELEDICDSFGILENGKVATYGNLLESKENINKYQVAFEEDLNKEDFSDFDVMHYSKVGRVITMVIRGEKEEVTKKLKEKKPLILDELSVNFEELFIYEMEARGEFYE